MHWVILAGKDGDDVERYQEKDIRDALRAVREAHTEGEHDDAAE